MFGKAKLGWQGETHELELTMEVIEHIDDEINVLATAVELDKGGIPKVTLIAKLYSILLTHAGCNVSKNDVYKSIMSNPADSADLVAAARYAVSLCFPDLESPEREKKRKG